MSHELAIAKPGSEIYLHVIDSLGVAPDHVLFLDDREDNVLAAHELGIRADLTCGIAQVIASISRSFPDLGI